MIQECVKVSFSVGLPTVDNPLDNLETRSIVNEVVDEIINRLTNNGKKQK